MFGHHDEKADDQDKPEATATEDNQVATDDSAQDQSQADQPAEITDDKPADDATATDEPAKDEETPAAEDTVVKVDDSVSESEAKPEEESKPEPETEGGDDLQSQGTQLEEDNERIRDVISPAGGFPKHPSFQYASPGSAPQGDDEVDQELIDIRKRALDDLSPLLDKLDLSPEDKFRTIMMMVQSNDDEHLVKAAYEAAHSIEDEKVRGQALLDIVNEINYFTAPHEDQSEDS